MTLTPEQQQSLDALIGLVPRPERSGAGASRAGEPLSNGSNGRPEAQPNPAGLDMLEVWTGISWGQLKLTISSLLGKKDGLEDRFRAWTDANPLDAAFEFLAACAWAFYQAEKEENPKVLTYTDAFYYIATCASVGYADIFAVTQAGKAIAGMVMVVGPAITNKTLDKPRR